MDFAWRNLPRKNKIARILNFVGLIVIVVLLAANRDRFRAMLNPESERIIGQTAPELADGIWINSQPLSLRQLRGKVVVLDFWTFRCRNCINILPVLKEWHEKYKDAGVAVVGVHSPETEEETDVESLRKFIADAGIQYPVVTDNNFATWNRYRAQFWPSTFVIDREGIVRRFHYGELGLSSVEDDIEGLIAD